MIKVACIIFAVLLLPSRYQSYIYITPSLLASIGGYYQNGDVDDDGNPEVDNVGILGRLAYTINNDLTLGANLSYDEALDTRFSADITWRFNTNGGPGKETPKTNAAIQALTSTPSNRDVRLHDRSGYPVMQVL